MYVRVCIYIHISVLLPNVYTSSVAALRGISISISISIPISISISIYILISKIISKPKSV